MSTCAVCQAEENREALVDEVFRVDGQYVLVGSLPAVVCGRCGEQTFSRETAEKVRRMIHGEANVTPPTSACGHLPNTDIVFSLS